jgi:hypothetical protein
LFDSSRSKPESCRLNFFDFATTDGWPGATVSGLLLMSVSAASAP